VTKGCRPTDIAIDPKAYLLEYLLPGLPWKAEKMLVAVHGGVKKGKANLQFNFYIAHPFRRVA
jgi:hypothetical protein